MIRNSKAGLICACLLTSFLHVSILEAADTKQAAPGPIPAQILSARKIFIANGGGDEPAVGDPLFNGGIDRSYNQFYAAMKNAGRYELVGSPAEADLLFAIQVELLPRAPYVYPGHGGGADSDPRLRLEICDPRTNALLWGFTEHVDPAILKGNRDKNFDQAEARIFNDVEGLAARAAGPARTASSLKVHGLVAVE